MGTEFQDATQSRLDIAGVTAAKANRSVVVRVEPGRYEFETLTIHPHVSLVFGSGIGREAELVYIGTGYQTCIKLRGDMGYGSQVAGCVIRGRLGTEPNVTGIGIENCLNCYVHDVRVDLRGPDCTGLYLAGRESITGQRLELRATNPITYQWGDNVSLTDLDLGATGNCKAYPNAVLSLLGIPHQVSLGGSFTAQGGDHLIFGELSAGAGQGLNIYNLRWEGSTSTESLNLAAVHLVCSGKRLENLAFFGSRWTDRKKAWNVYGVTSVTTQGCRLPGI